MGLQNGAKKRVVGFGEEQFWKMRWVVCNDYNILLGHVGFGFCWVLFHPILGEKNGYILHNQIGLGLEQRRGVWGGWEVWAEEYRSSALSPSLPVLPS